MNQKISYQRKYVCQVLRDVQLMLNRVSGVGGGGGRAKEIRKDLGYVMTELLRSARDLVGASVGSKG